MVIICTIVLKIRVQCIDRKGLLSPQSEYQASLLFRSPLYLDLFCMPYSNLENWSQPFLFFLVFSAVIKTPSDGEILIDFSKNRINEEVFALLVDLVRHLFDTIHKSSFKIVQIGFVVFLLTW